MSNPFEVLQTGVKTKPKAKTTPKKEQPKKEQPKEQAPKETPKKEQPKEQPKQAPKAQPREEVRPAAEPRSDSRDVRGGNRRFDNDRRRPPQEEGAEGSEPQQSKPWKRQDKLVEEDGVIKPKQRAFERHSGTGRNDNEKKRGAGRSNWGTPNSELEAAADAEREKVQEKEEEKVEVEAVADSSTPVLAVEATPATTDDASKDKAEEKKPAGPVLTEEQILEAKQITFSEYEKQLKADRVALPKPKARKANDDDEQDWSSFSPMVREEPKSKVKDQAAQAKKKEHAKKKTTKISIQDFVKAQPKSSAPKTKKQQSANSANPNEDFPPLAPVVETKA